jgi:hypothetical protein
LLQKSSYWLNFRLISPPFFSIFVSLISYYEGLSHGWDY